MAGYSTTRDALVERACKLVLHDWLEGIATGGSTSTLIDTSRLEKDDYFNSRNSEIYIRTATNAAAVGNTRKITDFVQSTNTITVSPAFGAAITAGDTYSVHTVFPRDEVVEAINNAIQQICREFPLEKSDSTSITLVANTYEYTIPAGFAWLYRVIMADSNGNFYDSPIPPDQYRVVRAASGSAKLRFQGFPAEFMFAEHVYGELWRNVDFATGRKLKLDGLSEQPALTTDASICYLNPGLVIAAAGTWLHASRIRRPENEPDDHRVQHQVWLAMADRQQREERRPLPPNAKRCTD